MSDIAVVGMSCRFAGANSLQEYWKLLLEGKDSFGPVPEDRWNHEAFLSKSSRDMDRTTSKVGAFIDDVRTFPALSLGIPPRRVEVMDPQQRFTIESALYAIEDAGYQPADLPEQTGVYVGVTATEYRSLASSRISAMMMASGAFGEAPADLGQVAGAVENVVPTRPFSAPGVLGNMAAAAVAQEFNLHGPAYTTDAACASAMMALSDAVAQLRAGQVDAAIAGGVYLQLSPEHYIAFSRIGAMSKNGQCLPFDERADGFVQGDGVGMVLLKRKEDAIRDGDRIYAVIHGVAVNNDGRGDGPMAPLTSGQRAVIEAAWKNAKKPSEEVSYIETHGTGTAVGDITEFTALQQALGDVSEVALGSAKANIGHTMSAAGIAGFIKASLSIYHRTIPPMANFATPKPALNLSESEFYIPTSPVEWTSDSRLTGVSSFGFGGTNSHVVLGAGEDQETLSQTELVLLSAADETKLRDLCARTAQAIRMDATSSLSAIAKSWSSRRPQAVRVAIVAETLEELVSALDGLAAGSNPEHTFMGAPEAGVPKLAFLFPGQGSQRLGMMSQLRDRFPIVRETLLEMEKELSDLLPVPLTHLLYPELRETSVSEKRALEELTATENCQPVLLACGVALARLLEQLGITPEVVLGHSLGEFTAASVAGVLKPESAARFVGLRGLMMANLPGDHGAMAAVMTERSGVESLLVDGAIIANENHPRQFVVSGTTEAIDQVVANALAKDVRAKKLAVSHGFHSPVLGNLNVAPLLDNIEFSDPTVSVSSAISSAMYADAADAKAVFSKHALSPVLFTNALTNAQEAGADVFLQVGAGGPLASFARGTLSGEHRGVYTLASREDSEGIRSLLSSLGQLWVAGVSVDLSSLHEQAGLASMPPSVLPREPYWAVKDRRTRALKFAGVTARPAAKPAPVKEEAPAVAAAPQDVGSDDETALSVMKVISKVSAYPLKALKESTRLMEDLGFDSLMIGDLATGLSEAFPGLGAIPQELFVNSPKVSDIVEFVAGGAKAAADHDDDAPLTAYRPVWRSSPLPELPGKEVPADFVLVTGAEPRTVETVVDQLRKQGFDAAACAPTDAAHADKMDLIVYVGPFQAPQGAESRRGLEQTNQLLAVLERQASLGATPHVVGLSRSDDLWSAGVAGTLRSVAREWETSTVKHLSGNKVDVLAKRLGDELTSADRTVDVRYVGSLRHVLGFEPSSADSELPSIGSDDVVAITGGTRGIGLKLGLRLAKQGAKVLLLGRSAPSDEAKASANGLPVQFVQADVTDRKAVTKALGGEGVTIAIHGAGVLADGPLGEVDASKGELARSVKVLGWLNLLDATRSTLKRIHGIGSWAGRLGNRHQAHYAAANALLGALASRRHEGLTASVSEFGPWINSDMASTIPAPVQAAMRADGVDFVGDVAGLDAIVTALGHGGAFTMGRRLPWTTRSIEVELLLSTDTDPYLLDHAIDGHPVLPLAGATDLMAWAADLMTPIQVSDVTLYQGVVVREPTPLLIQVSGAKASISAGESKRLAYTAVVLPIDETEQPPAPTTGGDIPELSLQEFYNDITFHGPLLQGITTLDAVGADFVRGTVKTGRPTDWTPATERLDFTIDPLLLDSVMQMAAHVAWTRYKRAGTPLSLGKIQLHRPITPGEVFNAEVRFGEASEDRFAADMIVRDEQGEVVFFAKDVVAELRKVSDGSEYADRAVDFTPSMWPEVQDLDARIAAVAESGLPNPYFHVHEGTARDTTVVEGRELINFSSYNYIGLSGDERILHDVREAVDRYGTSVSASRVASGERPFHGELEKVLAKAQGAEDALLFTAGHATNVTTIGHLMGPEDLILHDEYIHDSALQGIKLSGANRRGFRHEDPAHLEAQLRELRPHYRRCLIIVEGVYSMDGDICQLPEYIRLKKQYGAMLMVDEAHSFGVVGATGCGVAEHFGIDGREVDIWMGTLSKSLASCGGWISGSKALIRYLRYTAPGFVYSAGLTAANGVAALSAMRLMKAEPQRVAKLQSNAKFFCDELKKLGMDTGPALGGSGVIPVITGNSAHAMVLSAQLNAQGINAQPIVYPAVPEDAARLRFFLSSTHSFEQLGLTARTVAGTLEAIRKQDQVA